MEDDRALVNRMFNSIYDVLRAINIVGPESRTIFLDYLVLRLLEPHIKNNTIEIKDEWIKEYTDNEEEFNELKKNLLFSNLVEVPFENMVNMINYVCAVLSHHTVLSEYFRNFAPKIENSSILKKIFIILDKFPFEEIKSDILGEVYEDQLQKFGGNHMGQFFTPLNIRNECFQFVNIKENQKVLDMCAGAGGFLTHYINLCKDKKISINPNNIFGCEIIKNTFNIMEINMLMTGYTFKNIKIYNSLDCVLGKKSNEGTFDLIITNPPFGIKGLKCEDFDKDNSYYIKYRINKSEALFLQLIIHLLKKDGEAVIILPDGELSTGTNNKIINLREYLFNKCKITDIISFPAGTFKSTNARTLMIKFIKGYKTNIINYYKYDKYVNNSILQKKITHDICNSYNFALNFGFYKTIQVDYKKFISFEDILIIKNGKRIDKINKIKPEEYVEEEHFICYGAGEKMNYYSKISNFKGPLCKISKSAVSKNNCVLFIYRECYIQDGSMIIESKNQDLILNEYLWCFLYLNKHLVYKCAFGIGQKQLNLKLFLEKKIPLISIEDQHKYIKECEEYKKLEIKRKEKEKLKKKKRKNELVNLNNKFFESI